MNAHMHACAGVLQEQQVDRSKKHGAVSALSTGDGASAGVRALAGTPNRRAWWSLWMCLVHKHCPKGSHDAMHNRIKEGLNCCAQESVLAQVEAAAKSAPPKPPKAAPKPKGKVESLTDALTFKAGEPGDDKQEVRGRGTLRGVSCFG